MSAHIRVTLVKSPIGRLTKHKQCLVGLGLRRVGSSALLEDTPSIRGMIEKVKYLLNVEEGIRVVQNTQLGLWLTTSRGVGKKKIDLDHRWASPIRKPLGDGKPNGTWLYIAVEDKSGIPRVVGAFVYTKGRRLLFCPGIEVEVSPISDDASEEELVTVEHITLDPPKTSKGVRVWPSHIATRDEQRGDPRGVSWTLIERDQSMIPWFSLVIPHFDCLDALPNELMIPFDIPSSDSGRPKRVLGEYKRPVVFRAAESPPEDTQYFLQFDFWFHFGDSVKGLTSGSFSFHESEIDQESRSQKGMRTWSGQNDFDLLTNKLWIRTTVSVRRGIAERSCILAITSDKEALLL